MRFMGRKILGIRVDDLNLEEVTKRAEALIKSGGFHLVVTMNPEILMRARKDKESLWITNRKASIVSPDGIGIMLAGKLLGQSFKERITGNDLIEPLAQLCLQKKWPLMLMGGKPGVAQRALENLRAEYPGLDGVATSRPLRHAPDTFSTLSTPNTPLEIKFLADLIRRHRPALVFVALDFGEREKFILQLIKVLEKKDFGRGIVFVGIGGAIDYLAGTTKRAPEIIQKVGLEWLWRLATQPHKRLVRQLKSLPIFAFLVVRESIHPKN